MASETKQAGLDIDIHAELDIEKWWLLFEEACRTNSPDLIEEVFDAREENPLHEKRGRTALIGAMREHNDHVMFAVLLAFTPAEHLYAPLRAFESTHGCEGWSAEFCERVITNDRKSSYEDEWELWPHHDGAVALVSELYEAAYEDDRLNKELFKNFGRLVEWYVVDPLAGIKGDRYLIKAFLAHISFVD